MKDIAAIAAQTNQLFGEFQIRDYLQVVQRRKWWIILTAIAMTVMTTVVAFRLPNLYRAQTVILVDPQQVPNSYVTPTISASVADRLATLQQEVMSPTRLKSLIATLRLYPGLQGKVKEEELVAKLQKSILVDVVTQSGRQLSAFRIAFTGRDPVETAQVANQLAAMFIDKNIQIREQQSLGTTEFLEDELEKTKKDLAEKEAELRDVKTRNVMDLPESKQFHIEALDNLRAQLQASQDRVTRAQQEKLYIQSSAATNPPTVEIDSDADSGSSSDTQIQSLETRLSELQSRYGPAHPDVRKLKAQLQALKEQATKDMQAAPAADADRLLPRAVHNPVLEARLQQIDDEIAKQNKLQAELQEQINFHISKLERIPIFEQQIAGLMRDYDSLRSHYTSLLDKKLASEMASNLETREKGERFVVLDAAQVPDKPFAPNRLLIALAGLLGGICGGIGLAVLAEMADESVRSEGEVARIVGKVVLAAIPRIATKRQLLAMRMRAFAAVTGTAMSSLVFGFVISSLVQRFY